MSRIPSKDQILEFISENPSRANKREIARAFGIKGSARIDLKRVLRDLQDEGHLEKREKRFREPGALPPVTVAEAMPPDADGDVFLRPLEWTGDGDAPNVLFIAKSNDPGIGEGDQRGRRRDGDIGSRHTRQRRPDRAVQHALKGRRKIGLIVGFCGDKTLL